jgi:hypothetical protein
MSAATEEIKQAMATHTPHPQTLSPILHRLNAIPFARGDKQDVHALIVEYVKY